MKQIQHSALSTAQFNAQTIRSAKPLKKKKKSASRSKSAGRKVAVKSKTRSQSKNQSKSNHRLSTLSFKGPADLHRIRKQITAEVQSRVALLSSGVPSNVKILKQKRSNSRNLAIRKGTKDGDTVRTGSRTHTRQSRN